MRWYVVHARDYREYNEQLVAFGARLEALTGGALKVEFVYSRAGSGWRDSEAERDGYERVTAGEFDVSQLGVDTLGAKVINQPYVFRDYNHAEAIWRGPVGAKLMERIAEQSDNRLEAMAFSYSGGFRALVGTRPVRSAEDVKGAKVLFEDGLSPDLDLLVELGAVPAGQSPDENPVISRHLGETTRRISGLLAEGSVELFSVEINGLAYAEQSAPITHAPLFVSLTNHTMYATSIVANRAFLDSLDPELRRVLVEETRRFAVAERQLSALLAARNLDMFARVHGRTIVTVPEAALGPFREAGWATLRRHPTFAPMIKEIHAAGEIPLLTGAAAVASPV